jgi:hypothetical protein
METKLIKVETTELEKVVNESGLAIQEGEEIKKSYLPFLTQLSEIQSQASKINFESPTLLDEEIAGKLRKATVKIRTGAMELKDERKKIYLLRGNLEQASYNLIAASCKLTEETFGNVEKARQIAENKRKETLKAERIEKLNPYDIGTEFYDLANIPDEVFENLLSGAKTALENKIAAEKKAEADRLAKIEYDRLENERIRKENERLQSEMKERERLAEIERKKQADILKAQHEKADKERKELEEKNRKERELAEANAAKLKAENDAKLEAERKERERLAAELKAKQDAENKAKQDEQNRLIAEEKERRKNEKAPDKEKLEQFAKMIDGVISLKPSITDPELFKILADAKGLLSKVSVYIRQKSSEV